MKNLNSPIVLLLTCMMLVACSGKAGKETQLGLARTIFGEESAPAIGSMVAKAEEHRKRAEYNQALAINDRALEIGLRVHGERNWATLHAMYHKGLILMHIGKTKEAEPLLEKALELRKEVIGIENNATLYTMVVLAWSYQVQGRYIEAEALLSEALRLRKEYFGDSYSGTLLTQSNLAGVYLDLGRFQEAEKLVREVIDIARAELGEKDLQRYYVVTTGSTILLRQGKYQEAESIILDELAIAQKNLGESHDMTFNLMNLLAWSKKDQGKMKEAETLYSKALKLYEMKFDRKHPGTLALMNNLAIVYEDQGRVKDAEALYAEVLETKIETKSRNHPDVPFAMHNLAYNYINQGRFDEAESLIQKTLDLRRKILGDTHPFTLLTIGTLATLFLEKAQYNKAEPLIKDLLRIRRKISGENHFRTIEAMERLGALYFWQGRLEKAGEIWQETLRIRTEFFGVKNPATLSSLRHMALFHLFKNDFEKSEEYVQQILESIEGSEMDSNYQHWISESNLYLGWIYERKKQYAVAETYFRKALVVFKQLMGDNNLYLHWHKEGVASAAFLQGRLTEAEAIMSELYHFSEKTFGELHPITVGKMNYLGSIYRAQKQYGKAENIWRKSFRRTNRFLDQVMWAASDETRQSYLNTLDDAQNTYLTHNCQRNTPETIEEILYHSLTRKGLLLKISSEIKTIVNAGNNPKIDKLANDLRRKKQALANMTLSGPARQTGEHHMEYISSLKEEINGLEALLGNEVKRYKRSKTEITPEMVVRSLAPNETLVDFLVYTRMDIENRDKKEEQLIAVVVNRSTPALKLFQFGEYKPIRALIHQFRVEAANPGEVSEKDLKNSGKRLYQRLWKPLLPHLKGKKDVYLVPDSDLNLIPFAALVQPDGSYLIESYNIRTITSSRDVVLPPLTAPNNESKVFSAPKFASNITSINASGKETLATARNMQGLYFSSLPGTKTEGLQINRMINSIGSPSSLLSGTMATEVNLNRSVSPRILHLATHGFFLDNSSSPESDENIRAITHGLSQTQPEQKRQSVDSVLDPSKQSLTTPNIMIPLVMKSENPLLRSGLALTGANDGIRGIKQPDGTDGIFTAMEALGLDLTGTELVVLSACETGVGQIRTGEGVYGLRRAFQEAGAQAVLSTLWTISDQGTQVFMEKFYRRFLHGEKPQQALRNTQLEFMKSEDWSEPFYWAPFVIVGKE